MTSSNHSAPSVAVGHDHDMEAGGVGAWITPHETEFVDPFDIGNTKNASIETLKRWRQAALVLNASRRFRYTLDLRKEEEKEQRRRMIRAHAQVIRAALLFKLAGQRAIVLGSTVAPPTPSGDYSGDYEIGLEQVASMTRDNNNAALQQYGGARLADLLQTNVETGIVGGDDEFAKRRNAFGSNTYPVKKGRTFWRFLWEAWQDLTLIILMVAAIASLALGIKTEGLQEGWYDGGSIAFAVLLMTVVDAYVGRNKINPPEDSSQFDMVVSSLIHNSIAQNTSGSVFPSKDGGDIEVSGSPTEKAILHWGVKLGMKFDVIRSESEILQANSQVHIHWKGAAEIVLASCTGYLDSNGSRQSIDNDKAFFKKAIDDMAERSLRCVAFAYRSCEVDEVPSDEEQLEQWNLPEDDLVLLAIVGIKDPCRPGVKDAVKLCTDAGVKVRMVTGDNLQTAKAIAMECGILAPGTDVSEPTIIEGKTFRQLSEKEREQVAKKILVMGRSSPNDKLLLVQALRKGGDVVAVTGDGTNDAPALHEADIGLSMGIQGTEVAKENSDIIILDDNFASVVKVSDSTYPFMRGISCPLGRSVYANIQKFIQFQLTVNVTALIINVVAAISAGDVPLNAVQLLWVNLIMDTLGALALATEPPTDHLMHRSPVGRREPLITNVMWRNLIIQALYQVSILLVLNFFGKSILNLNDSMEHANQLKNSLIFNAFVLCQIFNEFNARKPDQVNVFSGILKNRLFVGIVGTTFLLQVRGLHAYTPCHYLTTA
ncbi:autoinhibited Ca(2+)-ATPase 9 [Actinidia rufa]|uniref:P-type Ca(2+) transporter n=1 Tax=Actinidia rufa TaxID=165716 RepID=A0A7J0FHD8_9ERIC|nr:autoinhibited Ca(2+)-ATPase 9 [Actinidia rufa]